jgi:hypothetical protein
VELPPSIFYIEFMGIALSAATVLLAFSLAMLGRFSSKEHPKANRAFVAISVLNVLVGIGLLVNASFSQYRQTELLTDLSTAQQRLLAKQEDQLRVGNELAGTLTNAQRTTERISSELTHNTKAVGTVLKETERALEPIGEIFFMCTLTVSDTDPESATIIRALEQSDRLDQASTPDIPEQLRSLLRPPPRMGGRVLPRSSPLFPKPTTALGALVDSAQVLLHFYTQHRAPSFYVHSKPPAPDLMTDITPTPELKWLMLTVPDHTLVIDLSGGVARGKWGSTGAILSVRDLVRAQAVVQPVFDMPRVTDNNVRELFLKKWAQISLRSLVMYTGDGRRWVLDAKSYEVVRARRDVPLFVGSFKGPVRPDSNQ